MNELIARILAFKAASGHVGYNSLDATLAIYDVYGIIDIDEDKTMEIIISETQYSQPDKSNEQIYKLKNKKYENITEK